MLIEYNKIDLLHAGLGQMMHTLSYLMKDDTLEPNALRIPANSTAMYPAPITAVFLTD